MSNEEMSNKVTHDPAIKIKVIGGLIITLMIGLTAVHFVPTWAVAAVGGPVILVWLLAKDVSSCFNRAKAFERKLLE